MVWNIQKKVLRAIRNWPVEPLCCVGVLTWLAGYGWGMNSLVMSRLLLFCKWTPLTLESLCLASDGWGMNNDSGGILMCQDYSASIFQMGIVNSLLIAWSQSYCNFETKGSTFISFWDQGASGCFAQISVMISFIFTWNDDAIHYDFTWHISI